MDYVAHLHGDHLRLAARPGQPAAGLRPGPVGGHDRARSTRRRSFAGASCTRRAYAHELDLWGHDVPHDWPSWRRADRPPPAALRADGAHDRPHLIGLLLGTEEDWPAAFETLLRRLGRAIAHGGATHDVRTERITIEPFDLRASRATARDRPAGALVLRPARVAEEGRADGRRVPVQQPVHVPGDGEALGLLRDDPARAEGARHLADPAQAAAATTRASPTPRDATTGRSTWTTVAGADRLPAVHEAVRRRRLGRRDAGSRTPPSSTAATTSPAAADAPAGGGRRLRRVRAELSIGAETMVDAVPSPTGRCTTATRSTTTS